jgi:hypothetical protein
MKNCILKLTTILFFAFIGQNVFSQNLMLQITETEFNKNTYPCIEVFIEPNPDEVKDAWEDFIKDNYDVKMKGNGLFTNKDVLRAEQVKFDVVSNKEMDFYTRIVEDDNQTKMCVFGSFGYDIPVSKKEYPNEFEAMEAVTKRFLKDYLPVYYKEWINQAQDKLTDLEDDRKDMKEKMEKNKKEIEKLTKENKELEESLIKNNTSIVETTTKLAVKKQTFSEINSRLQEIDTSPLDNK